MLLLLALPMLAGPTAMLAGSFAMDTSLPESADHTTIDAAMLTECAKLHVTVFSAKCTSSSYGLAAWLVAYFRSTNNLTFVVWIGSGLAC